MTGQTFSYSNGSAELGRSGLLTWLGDTVVMIADYNNDNIDPLGVEGWQFFGRTKNYNLTRTPEYFDVKTGNIETSKATILVGDGIDIEVTFDHATLLGWNMSANGLNYVHESQYAGTGQTTVASNGTTTSATLTSTAGVTLNDMFEVDLTSVTYGGFKELCIITSVSGNNVTFTRLATAPPNGATFKKIAGWGSSSTSTNSGIKIPMGKPRVVNKQLKKVSFSVQGMTIITEHFPSVDLIMPKPPTSGDAKTPMEGGITFRVIPTYDTLTDPTGIVRPDVPVLGNIYIQPYAF